MSTIHIKIKPLPDFGDLFTFEDFEKCCRDGVFIDYDGTGYYASEDGMTDIQVKPSMVLNYTHSRSFTHVMWFNR